MTLKEKIVKLYSEGNSYRDIVKILGCSSGTVSYHIKPEQRQKSIDNAKMFYSNQHPLYKKIITFVTNNKKYGNKHYSEDLLVSLKSRIKGFSMNDTIKKIKCEFNVVQLLAKLGDNPKCYLTGQPINLEDTSSYELDHIIPRSRGGGNSLDNANICLKHVNRAKNNMTPDEFIQMCQQVIAHNK